MTTHSNRPVLVKQCNYCPFAYYGKQATSDFCSYYDYADYNLNDILDAVITRDAPAPTWCPLRRGDVYIRHYNQDDE